MHTSKEHLIIKTCRNGDVVKLKEILSSCLKQEIPSLLNVRDKDGKTSLHEACIYSHIECIELLLASGANMNALKRADWTPLMLACTRENLSIIKILVNNGARMDIVNKDGWNAFLIAARKGCLNILEFLLIVFPDCWKCISNNGRTALHVSAINNQPKVINFLLKHTLLDLNCRDSCGTTPLMDAARIVTPDGLQLLLEWRADVFTLDTLGRNLLHVAAQAGSLECIKLLLLVSGLECNSIMSSNGFIPLHYAAREGHTQVLRYLLDNGADTNVKDSMGRTPLKLAELCHKQASIEILNEI